MAEKSINGAIGKAESGVRSTKTVWRKSTSAAASSKKNVTASSAGSGYRVYLDNVLLPVPPAKLELSIKNRNKVLNIVSGGEINVLKTPGLSEIKFPALLPNQAYSFAVYESGFQDAQYYLDVLERLKVDKKSFPLRVLRVGPGGAQVMASTSLTVSLEDYTIREDAEQYGTDMAVDLTFRQYQPYGTKVIILSGDSSGTEVNQRDAALTSELTTYTVGKDDTLYLIAKKLLGDGGKWTEIYDLNKDVIEEAARKDGCASSSNGNIIYEGTVLKIPEKASAQAVADGQNSVKISVDNSGQMTMRSGAVVTSGKVITIPSSVRQTGAIPNMTYWREPLRGKTWSRGTNQRRLFDEWTNRGQAVTNAVATINGCYLIATTLIFGTTGDAVCVYFENGVKLNCIIGDSKGKNAGGAGNEYGHYVGGGPSVDVIEWEYGNPRTGTDQANRDKLSAGLTAMGIRGVKVSKMINYGSWLDQ